MIEKQSFFLYRKYVISALLEDGIWWATARLSGKSLGGDRAVRGGPWKTEAEAKTAAEGFCDCGKAG
jgi:hypothetical protein